MRARGAILIGSMMLGMAPAALAGPAECDAIQAAFVAMADQAGYRQTVEMTSNGLKVEQVVIADMLYTRVNDRWTKLKLQPGGRKAMISRILGETQVSDCSEARVEALPTGNAKVYDFMLSPPKSVPGAKATRQVIWIGISDGLVHRMVGPETRVDISFERLVPPIP